MVTYLHVFVDSFRLLLVDFMYVRLFNPINGTSTSLRAYDVALSFTSLLVDQLTIVRHSIFSRSC